MRSIITYTIRIISAVILPFGSLFFSAFVIEFFANPHVPPKNILVYLGISLLFFALPLCILIFVKTKNLTQSSTADIPAPKLSIMRRPLNNSILVISLIILGIAPIIFLLLTFGSSGHF